MLGDLIAFTRQYMIMSPMGLRNKGCCAGEVTNMLGDHHYPQIICGALVKIIYV
jgi:hypothetical protein